MCGKCTINIVSLVTLTENFCLKNLNLQEQQAFKPTVPQNFFSINYFISPFQ